VGDAGNSCDVQGQACLGAVDYTYQISKYEVTNAQYAEFLNAVAAIDRNSLYDTNMAWGIGGITRGGSWGTYTYSTIAGREDMPVTFVSFWDTLRFANWMHNGQPTGGQGNATTEDGAYTVTADGITNNSITRNAGAAIWLPSHDEWYKAAFYDALSMSYFDYPAGSDTPTVCAAPGAVANTANCDNAVGDFTDVGSYLSSASPNGTFDQGGNVREWNEAIWGGSFRTHRGGTFQPGVGNTLSASVWYASSPDQISIIGFRVASLPEPGMGLLLACGLAGLGVRRRRH